MPAVPAHINMNMRATDKATVFPRTLQVLSTIALNCYNAMKPGTPLQTENSRYCNVSCPVYLGIGDSYLVARSLWLEAQSVLATGFQVLYPSLVEQRQCLVSVTRYLSSSFHKRWV